MGNLMFKCGEIELTVQGDAAFVAQERAAYVDFLKHKIGEDVLAAKARREKAAEVTHGKREAAPVEAPGEMAVEGVTAAPGKREEGQTVQLERTGIFARYRSVHSGYINPGMIAQKKAEGRLNELLHPYDEIDVPLVTGGTVTVVCGYVNTTAARFVFKDCWDEHVMNKENTNKTGYYGSDARKHILEDIYPNIAPEWREIMVPRKMVEIIDGERVEYEDPMWLPSATDVFGVPPDGYWKDEGENFQLPIFEKERDRVKECGEEGTYPWWTRSVYATCTVIFCGVHTSGVAYYHLAYSSRGFAPGFDA